MGVQIGVQKGSRRGPEGGPEGVHTGSKRGVQKGGSTSCTDPINVTLNMYHRGPLKSIFLPRAIIVVRTSVIRFEIDSI